MRDKTKNAVKQHIAALKSTDKYLLLGDSHSERLVWKYPELAPHNTWICAVGGDTVERLMWRIQNNEGTGYVDAANVTNKFEKIIILIGANDLKENIMKPDAIEEIVLNIKKMISILQNRWSSAEIILLPLLPTPSHSAQNIGNYDRMNDMLFERNLATKIVNWTGIIDEDFIDHGHLNYTGYKKFLNELAKFGLRYGDDAKIKSTKTYVERRIILLKKKLEKIKVIKNVMNNANKDCKLEKTQIDLINRESEIEKELQELKEW
jgi:hypothetical protein